MFESGATLEDGRQQEVEQRPQFGQFVLQRRPGEQQAVRRDVVRVQHLRQLAVVVLHAVALVDYHVLPLYLKIVFAIERRAAVDGSGLHA